MSQTPAASQQPAASDELADTTRQATQPADGHCTISSQPESSCGTHNAKHSDEAGSASGLANSEDKLRRIQQGMSSRAPLAELDEQGIHDLEGFRSRQGSQQGAEVMHKQAQDALAYLT